MTSPRQTAIKRVRETRLYISGLAFLGFWTPFMFFWVFCLEPWQIAGGYSLLFGCGFSCILYVLWRPTTARLDRLRKYEDLFNDFFEAMIDEMEANDAEKGDSWLMTEETELRTLQNRTINKLQSKKRTVADDFDYQKELANYCAMVWLRGRQLK